MIKNLKKICSENFIIIILSVEVCNLMIKWKITMVNKIGTKNATLMKMVNNNAIKWIMGDMGVIWLEAKPLLWKSNYY